MNKFQRKQLRERLTKPKGNEKKRLWWKYVRQIAVEQYLWLPEPVEETSLSWDHFVHKFREKLDGDLGCDVYEIWPYYEKYLDCVRELKRRKKRADIIQRHYKPLEDDLFEIC